jgi:hypothetical protein
MVPVVASIKTTPSADTLGGELLACVSFDINEIENKNVKKNINILRISYLLDL